MMETIFGDSAVHCHIFKDEVSIGVESLLWWDHKFSKRCNKLPIPIGYDAMEF